MKAKRRHWRHSKKGKLFRAGRNYRAFIDDKVKEARVREGVVEQYDTSTGSYKPMTGYEQLRKEGLSPQQAIEYRLYTENPKYGTARYSRRRF